MSQANPGAANNPNMRAFRENIAGVVVHDLNNLPAAVQAWRQNQLGGGAQEELNELIKNPHFVFVQWSIFTFTPFSHTRHSTPTLH